MPLEKIVAGERKEREIQVELQGRINRISGEDLTLNFLPLRME